MHFDNVSLYTANIQNWSQDLHGKMCFDKSIFFVVKITYFVNIHLINPDKISETTLNLLVAMVKVVVVFVAVVI